MDLSTSSVKEKLSHSVSHENLFNKESHLNRMRLKETSEIFREVICRSNEIWLRRKSISMDERFLIQDEQWMTTRGKVTAMRRADSLLINSVGIIFQVGSAAVGAGQPNVISGGLMALAQTCSTTAGYQDKKKEAEIEIFNFTSQRLSHSQNDRTQDSQEASKQFDQNAALLDRNEQNTQQTFNTAVSGNG